MAGPLMTKKQALGAVMMTTVFAAIFAAGSAELGMGKTAAAFLGALMTAAWIAVAAHLLASEQ